ncbi:MAG: hypothetical protein LWX56_09020 [Ignavibacteria bacterium]|nr:hypothetical protein [Ignavibacteria bacterium]
MKKNYFSKNVIAVKMNVLFILVLMGLFISVNAQTGKVVIKKKNNGGIITVSTDSVKSMSFPAISQQYINNINGGNIISPQGAVLTIPANALPTSGNVYVGRTGNEPLSVSNSNLTLAGSPVTIGLPVSAIQQSIKLTFKKPAITVPMENYGLFLYNGETYYPIEYMLSGDSIKAVIDTINWQPAKKLYRSGAIKDPQLLTEIVLIGLIIKQTPPAEQMGLKQVNVAPSGELSFSQASAADTSEILLLIHGWTSQPAMWKTMIKKIRQQADPSLKIWTFGYNSSWSISSNAALLAQQLSQSTNGAKLDIIAHSMGGLVSRSMIEGNNGAQYVQRLITLGTPHRGSPLGAIRGFLGLITSLQGGLGTGLLYNYFTQGFRDLYTNSSYIQSMMNMSNPSLPYYLIAATNDAASWYAMMMEPVLPGPDDGVVQEVSARGVPNSADASTFSIPVIMAHTEMPENGAIYQQVINYLKPHKPELASPVNGDTNQTVTPTLKWRKSLGAKKYSVQVAKDSIFTSVVFSKYGISDTLLQADSLKDSTQYYWRVKSYNAFDTTNASDTYSFRIGSKSCPGTPVVIYAGQTYNTVQIGTQCWLKENLNVGTRINGSQDQANNGVIEKYCYNDIESNCTTYGGLYQWNEAMKYVTTTGTRGICPQGWHIPTYAEFYTLLTTVNGDGNALKAIGQGTGSGTGNNTSGFSALLAGYRNYNGLFYDLGSNALFWSSPEYDSGFAFFMNVYYYNSYVYLYYNGKQVGFSVRCLKD